MPITLTIDGRDTTVEAGTTVLDAARQLGIDVPTLCHLERCGPMNSCLVCLVKVRFNGAARVVPACGTKAVPGMVVESETAEIRDLRRGALELLFSDHVGDCLSPCHRICPLDLNIPRMIRQIQGGQMEEAIKTVRTALPMPGTLGRLCHAPCENGCRRSGCGGSAAIRDLERYVADTDHARPASYVPDRKPATGKRVAIVGAGPAGLAAADALLRQGHTVTVYDRRPDPGGTLRDVAETELAAEVLAADLAGLERSGAVFQCRWVLGRDGSVDSLRRTHDAVLLAIGELGPTPPEHLDLPLAKGGIQVDSGTGRTGIENVFAVGSAVRPVKALVRAMSEGQAAAACLHQFLAGHPVRPAVKALSSVMGRLDDSELMMFLQSADPGARVVAAGGAATGFSPAEAQQEASRCLHCDCRAAGHCGLQHYAALYGANPNRFARQRRRFRQELHPAEVIFESGKCILCGICVELARQAAEPLGLTFVGRGFDVQVAAPLNHAFAEGLERVAADCVEFCPTGAIVFRDTPGPGGCCGGLTGCGASADPGTE